MQPVNFPVATFNQTNVVVLVFGEQALPDVLVTELAALLHRSAPLNIMATIPCEGVAAHKTPCNDAKDWRERRELEPATSCVTGRRSKQLNYAPNGQPPSRFVPSCTLRFPLVPSGSLRYHKMP